MSCLECMSHRPSSNKRVEGCRSLITHRSSGLRAASLDLSVSPNFGKEVGMTEVEMFLMYCQPLVSLHTELYSGREVLCKYRLVLPFHRWSSAGLGGEVHDE